MTFYLDIITGVALTLSVLQRNNHNIINYDYYYTVHVIAAAVATRANFSDTTYLPFSAR
jgi:hypothetical protein